MRKRNREARGKLNWGGLSADERAFVNDYSRALIKGRTNSAKIIKACQLLSEYGQSLTPQTQLYVHEFSAPFILALASRPASRRIAGVLVRDVKRLAYRTDRDLRRRISRLEQKNVSLESRVAELSAKVRRIPGFSRLYDEHCSLERRYTKLMAKYHGLEGEIRGKVSRKSYNALRDENAELGQRLRKRVSREKYGALEERMDGLRSKNHRITREYFALQWMSRGKYLVEQGHPDRAVKAYEKALKYAPKGNDRMRGVIQHDLGVAYENRQKYRLALEWYAKAKETLPGEKDIEESFRDCARKVRTA